MAELVRKADFIFVMTYGHLDSMLLLFPSAAEKTFLLREFETDLPVMEREVSDPIGQSRKPTANAATRSGPRCPACSISSCARPTTKRA
jgi:protein-tyrosine-phosphatase